jgi:predicted dehydrogenase
MGRNHARVLSNLPGIELVAVADHDPSASSPASEVLVVRGISQLLSCGIDMCVVAAPTRTHFDLGMRLAEAGVHALIEKPLAVSADQGRRLADAFSAAGLVGCVGHIERFNPAARGMRDLVRRSEIGRVLQITTSRQGPFPERIRDVGVVLDLASHDIDLTRWISGCDYEGVAAATTRIISADHEDMAAVTGTLRDGTVVNHLVNWLSPLKERLVTVTGTRGCLRADLLAGDLWLRHGELAGDGGAGSASDVQLPAGQMIPCPVATQEPLRTELEAFREAVRGCGTDVISLREGAEVLEVAAAMLATTPSLIPALTPTDAL